MRTLLLIACFLSTATHAERVYAPHPAHWCAALIAAHGSGSISPAEGAMELETAAKLVAQALPTRPARVMNPFEALGRLRARNLRMAVPNVGRKIKTIFMRRDFEELGRDLLEIPGDLSGLKDNVIAFGQVVRGQSAITDYLFNAHNEGARLEEAGWLRKEPYWKARRLIVPAVLAGVSLASVTPLALMTNDFFAHGQIPEFIAGTLWSFANMWVALDTTSRAVFYPLGVRYKSFRHLYRHLFTNESAHADMIANLHALNVIGEPKNPAPLGYVGQRLTLPTDVVDKMLAGAPKEIKPAEPGSWDAPGAELPMNQRHVLIDHVYVRDDQGEPTLLSFIRIKRVPLGDRKPPRKPFFDWVAPTPKGVEPSPVRVRPTVTRR